MGGESLTLSIQLDTCPKLTTPKTLILHNYLVIYFNLFGYISMIYIDLLYLLAIPLAGREIHQEAQRHGGQPVSTWGVSPSSPGQPRPSTVCC